MNMRHLLAPLAALLIASCASNPEPSAPEPLPIASDNDAVVALVHNARDDAAAGKFNAAAAHLERALRIEPRNALLWHDLARVTLYQGQAEQAVQLATKSNTFAGRNPTLRASNWRLIGQARTQSGDQDGAESAFDRAAQIERER
jgi:cytochrome c-type biogenesis protein CcmH/NrfG